MSMAATRALQMRCTFCSTLFSTTKRCTVVACVCMQYSSTHTEVVSMRPAIFVMHTGFRMPSSNTSRPILLIPGLVLLNSKAAQLGGLRLHAAV